MTMQSRSSEDAAPVESPVPALPGTDAQAFVDKWHARWPEWRVAEVFVPPDQRPLAVTWAALQQELADAAWGGSDPRPGEAKLQWWQEELLGWTQGRRRHPLGQLLQQQSADWASLAMSLTALAESRARPRDAEHACAQMEPIAEAVVLIEQRLFPVDAEPGQAGDLEFETVTAQWLHARLVQQGEAAVPLALLARSGSAPALPGWRSELARRWPRHPACNRPRRLWTALALARLQSPEERPLPLWRALLRSWRAARN